MKEYQYVKLKGYKERNDLAKSLRQLHGDNPRMARLFWKAYKKTREQLSTNLANEVLLSGSNRVG